MVLVFISSLLFAASATDPENPDTFLGPNPVYDNNSAYCVGQVQDSDSTEMDVTVNWTVSSVEVYNQTLTDVPNGTEVNSTLGQSNFSEDQQVLCNMTVYDGSVGSSQSSWEFDSIIAETFDPQVLEGPVFHNYTELHAFNVSAILFDREKDDEARQCWLQVSDGDGNERNYSMNMDRSYGDDEEFRCFYSRIENTSNFEVLEDLEITLWANDSGGGESNWTEFNTVPNSPPLVYDIQPEDDSETGSSTVTLKASVLDRNGEEIDVRFYNDTGTDNVIHQNLSMSPGTTTSYDWSGLDPLGNYYWYVNASDDHEYVIERLRFRNGKENPFRIETEFINRYSAFITSPNETRLVPYTVRNTASTAKNDLTTSVYGADARFASTGTSTISNYALTPGEERTFRIEISPEEPGDTFLNISTENNVYEVTTNDTQEILVFDTASNVPEAPGIGMLQLLFLLLASITLYHSGRL